MKFLWGGLFLLVAAVGVPVLAQNPGPATAADKPAVQATGSNDDSAETIKKTVNEVNVVFTVTDKHGHYVRDLKKDDFKVLDDNKPIEGISSFHTESDLPLQVG
ncbi:MAG TPA: hypothetical protein VJQ82_24830, partial [Terriglobales bacterium]|nr:hypothetical protein [Terriglobales bacterium]